MILLFSGGIDSYVAWHYLGKPPTLYFDVCSRYSEKELIVIKKLIPNTIIDASLFLGDREVGEKAYIPFRNLFFALQATKYDDRVVIAGVADDDVSDKNEEIFAEFSVLMTKLEGRQIEVTSPFWKMTKEDVVRWYVENVGDSEILKTVSCYSPEEEIYCAKCPSCFRKWVALRSNGYNLPFENWPLMKDYLASAMADKYLPSRNKAIIREVNRYYIEVSPWLDYNPLDMER
jgi:7-cyano-7-deazaguanine synthase in queuosine biosynthesis